MAVYSKYEVTVEDFMNKVHDLLGTAGSGADTLKVALSNTAPDATTNALLADIAEIAAGFGYSAGGVTAQNAGTRSGGTVTLVGTSFTITATGGPIGPFRYVVLYNSTAAGGPLIAFWDYGSAITLNDGESFSIRFNASSVGSPGTIFTLA